MVSTKVPHLEFMDLSRPVEFTFSPSARPTCILGSWVELGFLKAFNSTSILLLGDGQIR